MIKKLVLVFIALVAIQSYSQEGTTSPYSFYGIGSLKFKGTVENRSMAGLSIYSDSIHINLQNPASYAGKNLDIYNNESRPVKFTVGGSNTDTKIKSDTESAKVSASTFDYLALSIPLGKLGFGFGLLPYTSVGYKLETEANSLTTNQFKGEGGVNKAFLSFGYQITDDLSIGIDANYNFGNIQNSSVAYLYDASDVLLQYQTREINTSDLSGVNFNLGLNYTTKISDKLQLNSGLTYTPESNLSSINERVFSTIVISSTTGQETIVNSIDADLATLGLAETELTLPSKISFGAGLGQPNKWFVGAEFTSLKTSSYTNRTFNIANATFEDATKFAIGGFYIPNYNSFSGYFKRIVYRAGVRFENTGLVINNESINEFGMSFGVGLPVGRLFSNANVGFEFGKRGTTNQGLLQENFTSLFISLSLNDRWFKKRKYN